MRIVLAGIFFFALGCDHTDKQKDYLKFISVIQSDTWCMSSYSVDSSRKFIYAYTDHIGPCDYCDFLEMESTGHDICEHFPHCEGLLSEEQFDTLNKLISDMDTLKLASSYGIMANDYEFTGISIRTKKKTTKSSIVTKMPFSVLDSLLKKLYFLKSELKLTKAQSKRK